MQKYAKGRPFTITSDIYEYASRCAENGMTSTQFAACYDVNECTLRNAFKRSNYSSPFHRNRITLHQFKIHQKLLAGMTQTEIAREQGVTRQCIHQTAKKVGIK